MIQTTEMLPGKAPRRGRRVKEIENFLASGSRLGAYVLEDGEKADSIYHVFRAVLIKMGKADLVDVVIRRGQVYLIRRDI